MDWKHRKLRILNGGNRGSEREREREKNLQVLAVAVPRVRENPKMQA